MASRIDVALPRMNDSEATVARVLLTSIDDLAGSSISDVARVAGTSTSTNPIVVTSD